MNLPKINCNLCKHSAEVEGSKGMLECRRYPPTFNLIMSKPRVQGAGPGITKQSDFPNCMEVCGEFQNKSGEVQ